MSRLYLSAMSLVCSLGGNHEEVLSGLLKSDNSKMKRNKEYGIDSYFGIIEQKLPDIPEKYENIMCNKILAHCYHEISEKVEFIKEKYGKSRIAVIIGSSNTGIHEEYFAIKEFYETGVYPKDNFKSLEFGTSALFLADYAGLTGPTYTVSTACSSSTKVLASAKKLMDLGICDAALVGGADNLCTYAINGFNALEAVSYDRTIPFSKNRKGLNLGEGGALFLLTKENFFNEDIELLAIGETSDAYHITSPHPEGEGAYTAMKEALKSAGLKAEDINYINLHGTGTELNDKMESYAVYNLFGDQTFCSSTKGLTGHTLGACGALELAFCWLLLSKLNKDNKVPPHFYDNIKDEELSNIKLACMDDSVNDMKYCMSNSFAFGGSNISVIIGKKDG